MGVKKELLNFSTASSIRGLSRLTRATSCGIRTIWIAALLIGGSVAAWYLTKLLQQYFNNEVVTEVKKITVKAKFPAVTLCNLQPFNSRVDHKKLKELEENYQRQFSRVTDGMLSDRSWLPIYREPANYFTSTRALFQNMQRKELHEFGHSQRDFIVECQWNEWMGSSKEKCEHIDHSVIYHPDYFLCHKYYLQDRNWGQFVSSKVQSVRFILYIDDFFDYIFTNLGVFSGSEPNKGVVIYIHPNETLPDFERGIGLSAGHNVVIELDSHERKILPPPYRECTEDKYVKLLDNDTSFLQDMNICVRLCYQKAMIKDANCILPDYPFDENMRDIYPFCGNLSEAQVLPHIPDWWGYLSRAKIDCENPCKEPCSSAIFHHTLYQSQWPHLSYHLQFYQRVIKRKMRPGVVNLFAKYEQILRIINTNHSHARQMLKETDLISRNFIDVTVRRPSQLITRTQERPQFTVDLLLGTMGGLLNMWIGISLVTLFELLDLFYNLFTNVILKPDRNMSNSAAL